MNRHSSSLTGYLAAAFCICVWGTTYISSKILLRVITPVELLLIRFVIGYLVLWIIQPKRLRTESLRDEVRIAACGLTVPQAAFALAVLRDIELIDASLSPFRVSLRPMQKRGPEESKLFQLAEQIHFNASH